MSTIKEIIHRLGTFPDSKKRNFEIEIGEYMKSCGDDGLTILNEIVQQSERDLRLRFNAYFCLAFHYRRKLDLKQYKGLITAYSEDFSSIPFNNHVLAMYYSELGGELNLRQALKFSKKLQEHEDFQRHLGALHSYCRIVITLFENGLMLDDPNELNNAIEKIDIVLSENDQYAKYYHTKARLIVEKNRFPEAIELVYKAIELEDSKVPGYEIRINHYRSTLLDINYRRQHNRMEEELEKQLVNINDAIEQNRTNIESKIQNQDKVSKTTIAEMNSMRQQNLQMLAFFTAIISFTIGSINIVGIQEDFYLACLLILVLAGSLLLVNLSIGMIFTEGNLNWKKNLFIGGIGMLLIALAIAIYIVGGV